LLLALVIACSLDVGDEAPDVAAAGPAAAHPPGGDCASCHVEQAEDWTGSQHQQAMQPVGEVSALGRFDGQPVTLPGGLTVTPLLDAGGRRAFRVRDAAGEVEWPVAWTFGVTPLQQYLLTTNEAERPGEDRLVVAPVAWDVAAERWFDPAPDGASADPTDPLHWAGLFSTWNHMCAACHATGVSEAYDPASDTYATTMEHSSVHCTACHGGGEPTALATSEAQITACGPCHSRRDRLSAPGADGDALLDHYRLALLDDPLFAADGGARDDHEPFELGSWLQSRMHQEGVRCTDCHDPHTARPRAEGDALCQRCHQPAQYAAEHHGHPGDSEGARCVSCHMPEARFMGVDLRRDHNVRPPTPALSASVGGTDACTRCHEDQTPEQAQAWLDGRSGASPSRSDGETPAGAFAEAVSAARAGDAGALPVLAAAAVDPSLGAFRQASALALCRLVPPPRHAPWLLQALEDADPMVRAEAATTAGAWGGAAALWPVLSDPVRAPRVAAARALVASGARAPDAASDRALKAAIAELEAGLVADADEPSAQTNLGVLRYARGDLDGAIAAWEIALAAEPAYRPARDNLIAALVGVGRREEAAAVAAAAP